MTGHLVVVGTPIGNLGDLTPRALGALTEADVVYCEDTRRTRALLAAMGVPAPRLVAHHIANEAGSTASAVAAMEAGSSVALVTDAGMPLVSDPGGRLVAAAVAAGILVTSTPGPTAAVTALVLSGLATDRWCMEGFLPRKGQARRARLDEIAAEERTTVVYEAARRLAATLGDLCDACGPARPVAVARELTKLHEEVWRGSAGEARTVFEEPGRARGEVVVVVAGRDPEPVSDDVISARLAAVMADGTARRDAVASVARDLGVGRSRVYALELMARAAPPGPTQGDR